MRVLTKCLYYVHSIPVIVVFPLLSISRGSRYLLMAVLITKRRGRHMLKQRKRRSAKHCAAGGSLIAEIGTISLRSGW